MNWTCILKWAARIKIVLFSNSRFDYQHSSVTCVIACLGNECVVNNLRTFYTFHSYYHTAYHDYRPCVILVSHLRVQFHVGVHRRVMHRQSSIIFTFIFIIHTGWAAFCWVCTKYFQRRLGWNKFRVFSKMSGALVSYDWKLCVAPCVTLPQLSEVLNTLCGTLRYTASIVCSVNVAAAVVLSQLSDHSMQLPASYLFNSVISSI